MLKIPSPNRSLLGFQNFPKPSKLRQAFPDFRSSVIPRYRLFGNLPWLLNGVDFYSGTPDRGMIVFKTIGTYSITPSEAVDVEVLVIAGGGGGGANAGGGGGAGGLKYNGSFAITQSAITVIIGSGGVPAVHLASNGTQGGSSQFSTISTTGGGYGARGGLQEQNGGSGGSGGGGAAYNSIKTGGAGVSGEGYSGGNSTSSNDGLPPAGGGGAGGAGNNNSRTTSGSQGVIGGIGVQKFGFWYAGGGSSRYSTGASNGGTPTNTNGLANTGAGGGDLGHGASGIVIVRWGGYNKNYNPITNQVF